MKYCAFVFAFASVAMWGQNLPQIRNIDPNRVTILKGPGGAYAVILPNVNPPATAPLASTCVVPLLPAPVNPNVDPKMLVLKLPKFNSESAEIVKGPPPCGIARLK